MPAWLIREAQVRYDFTRWDGLYALKDEAQIKVLFPKGYKAIKPYLRVTPQPAPTASGK